MLVRLGFAMALLAASLPAMAQDVDGWNIEQVVPGACEMLRDFDDNVSVSYIEAQERPGLLGLISADWTLKENDSFPARLSADNWKTSQEVTLKTGRSDGGSWAVYTLVPAELGQRIRAQRGFQIRIPTMRIDRNVALSANALAVLAVCVKRG